MKIKISVPEVVELIKELQSNPTRIFEMIGMNVQKDVGDYLTNLMKAELTHFLGRGEYERGNGESESSQWQLSPWILHKRDWRGRGKGSERSEW